MKNSFSETIKKLQKESGMQHKEFAKFLDVSTGALSNYKSGKQIPKADALISIASKCNCSIDYLLGYDEHKTRNGDLKSACTFTGLSENAVSILHNPKYKDLADTVSILIEDAERIRFQKNQADPSLADQMTFNQSHFGALWTIQRFLNIDVKNNSSVVIDAEGNVFRSLKDADEFYKLNNYRPEFTSAMQQKAFIDTVLNNTMVNSLQALKEYRISQKK